ncbi:peptidoglycan DD-metalloendopeptidase family protein [Vogesella indigofera]|uniref:peptidoglycan DD-metalloendopeptidase family protein n=1 Tax=Vogesella indigofera TaxID=45465 RepID=UPI00234EE3FB|nr:peptidoglycan DD-metalloendopeptidase family protein [Vogesella indigofera]MDC7706269.1 peptidoglycan DD-metalloendopeptidase family protein [Vogesella indigofera]
MMQGTNATTRTSQIVRQFTASSELAYNIFKPMYKHVFKLIQPLPFVLPLLLAACATSSPTPAPIVAGQASVLGSTASGSKATNSGPVATGTQSSPIRLGSLPKANTPTAGSTHQVQAGETLYRIAVNNGLRYQDLAEWNNLDGYNIKVGQTLRLTPPGTATPVPVAKPPVEVATASNTVSSGAKNGNETLKQYPKALKLPYSENANKQLPQLAEGSSSSKPPAPQEKSPQEKLPPKVTGTTAPATTAPTVDSSRPETAAATGSQWQWPTQGKVLRGFSEQNKGINISGKLGQPVMAANDGKVVYSGSGLRGYGKLIIIRHDKTYLSAYAHNSALVVKEGQAVKKGQKIAEMGDTDADQVKLHFEIREMGKPVDPSKFLEAKP